MRKLFAFISVLFVLPLAAQDAGAVRQLQKLTQVYRYLNGLYVDEVDMQPLVESAITGMLEDLDPHSAYIGADEMKGVQESFREMEQALCEGFSEEELEALNRSLERMLSNLKKD